MNHSSLSCFSMILKTIRKNQPERLLYIKGLTK